MVVTSVNLSPEVVQWLEQRASGNLSAYINNLVKTEMGRKKSAFGSLKHLKGLDTKGLREKKDRADEW